MTYRERLTVPVWWWLVGGAFTATMALAVWAYLGWQLGLAATMLFFCAVGALLWGYGSVLITVDDELRVGRARVGWDYVGEVEALDEERTTEVLGRAADPRAYLVTRPYAPRAVRVLIADPADPHPYWLVSSRHPERFAAAVREAAGR